VRRQENVNAGHGYLEDLVARRQLTAAGTGRPGKQESTCKQRVSACGHWCMCAQETRHLSESVCLRDTPWTSMSWSSAYSVGTSLCKNEVDAASHKVKTFHSCWFQVGDSSVSSATALRSAAALSCLTMLTAAT
jgi:hypothetical protein